VPDTGPRAGIRQPRANPTVGHRGKPSVSRPRVVGAADRGTAIYLDTHADRYIAVSLSSPGRLDADDEVGGFVETNGSLVGVR